MSQVVWLRQPDILVRYRWKSEKSAHRAVEDGRLPPPEYPLSPAIPMWRSDRLEAHEAAQSSKNTPVAQARPTPAGFPIMQQGLARSRARKGGAT
jgi:hypothetical protein